MTHILLESQIAALEFKIVTKPGFVIKTTLGSLSFKSIIFAYLVPQYV